MIVITFSLKFNRSRDAIKQIQLQSLIELLEQASPFNAVQRPACCSYSPDLSLLLFDISNSLRTEPITSIRSGSSFKSSPFNL
jgi:hypothetical protein